MGLSTGVTGWRGVGPSNPLVAAVSLIRANSCSFVGSLSIFPAIPTYSDIFRHIFRVGGSSINLQSLFSLFPPVLYPCLSVWEAELSCVSRVTFHVFRHRSLHTYVTGSVV